MVSNSVSTLKGSDQAASLKLDDLIHCSKQELDELFLAAATPTLEEIQGITRGRSLAGKFILCCWLGRRLVNLPLLPWKGKIFEGVSESEGKGINRMELWPLKTTMFRFQTRVVAPLVGKNDVVTLNYDFPHNPWLVRQVRDDLKKLRDGLFLGSANFRWKGEYRFVLYFGLELITGEQNFSAPR